MIASGRVNTMDSLWLRKALAQPETQLLPRTSAPTRASLTTEGGFLEAWGQGNNVGSLVILILIVFCNYRSGIWLHKLILLELVLAIWHGTFIFVPDPAYGWYLSSTALLLFISYQIHNVVSWLKIRPFLPRWGSRVFIISLICVQPFWIAEAWSNFEYFNSLGNNANIRTRPWEALFRDPWWIFTTWKLLDAIKKTYGFQIGELIKINRRFGVMLLCMFLSIAFLLADVIVSAAKISAKSGINPYWRFALVFKCASDTIILDDFKSVLDDIVNHKFGNSQKGVHRGNGARQSGHIRSMSTNPAPDCAECNTLGNTFKSTSNGPSAPESNPSRQGYYFPCFDESTSLVLSPQKSTTGSQATTSSDGTFVREDPAVPRAIHPRRRNSEVEMMIGKIV